MLQKQIQVVKSRPRNLTIAPLLNLSPLCDATRQRQGYEQALRKSKLRVYQLAGLREVRRRIQEGRTRILVYSPTGSGKTLLAISIIIDALTRGRKVLFLVHRDILIAQTIAELRDFGIECGVIAGRYPESRSALVQVASAQTLTRRGEWFTPELVIHDECHTVSYTTIGKQHLLGICAGANIQTGLQKLLIQEFGLNYPCTFEEIKAKYRELSFEKHPDTGGSHKAFITLNNGYETLKAYKDGFPSARKIEQAKQLQDGRRTIYIGLTASPWRLSKSEGLGDLYEVLVSVATPSELIEQGYLVPPDYYSVAGVKNLKGVRTRGGDFKIEDLDLLLNAEDVIKSAVAEYRRLAYGRRTIAFAVTVAHAKAIAAEFNVQGIPAASVDGSTPYEERKKIYTQLATGEILVLSSVACLSEGFNVPELSCVLLCRPTKSKALYVQMVGRGLRTCPAIDKRDCLVLDQSASVRRHGFIQDLKEVKLTYGAGAEPEGKQEPRAKDCPGCGALLRNTVKVCPRCNYEFAVEVEETHEDHRLKPSEELIRLLAKDDIPKFQFFRDALKLAYASRYYPGYAANKFKDRYGYYPPNGWALGAVFGDQPTKDDRTNYRAYLTETIRRLGKPTKQVNWYFESEFGAEAIQLELIPVGGVA